MLLGTHDHTLDDKNRLTLPAKFRESFAEGLVVARGFEGSLRAFRRADWDGHVESRLAPLDPLSKETRRLQRFYFAHATESNLDKQGRVMIPAPLLELAGISKDVVVVGMRNHIEIWDRETWRNELAEVEGSAEDVAERLAAKND
jgi:MraZ protein